MITTTIFANEYVSTACTYFRERIGFRGGMMFVNSELDFLAEQNFKSFYFTKLVFQKVYTLQRRMACICYLWNTLWSE